MQDSDPVDYIARGSEQRNLEYKRPLPWGDNHTKVKICRAMMAMANLRDGGVIVIGMEEGPNKGSWEPVGISKELADEYSHDGVAEWVNRYASPSIDFSLHHVQDNGKHFIVILVNEFAEYPVVCQKDGLPDLKRGTIYTRSRKKHETVPVSHESEMREIIELATEKRIQRFQEQIHRAGLRVTNGIQQRFDGELNGL